VKGERLRKIDNLEEKIKPKLTEQFIDQIGEDVRHEVLSNRNNILRKKHTQDGL
jgi:hypothetical protein